MQLRAYVVEDNEDVLHEISALLSRDGLCVEGFSRPEDVLHRGSPKGPDVVILDMRMPGLSGLDLLRILRARGVSAPFIFVSGESQPSEIIEAMRDRDSDFLLKPFSGEQLLSMVHAVLERYRQYQERAAMRAEASGWQEWFQLIKSRLSPREGVIFEYVMKGYSNREIADATSSKIDTIKKQRASIYLKFDVENLAGLLEASRRAGENF